MYVCDLVKNICTGTKREENEERNPVLKINFFHMFFFF